VCTIRVEFYLYRYNYVNDMSKLFGNIKSFSPPKSGTMVKPAYALQFIYIT